MDFLLQNANLEQQKWLSEQFSIFEDLLQHNVEDDIEPLTKSVLTQLSSISNANKSIFFIFDEQKQTLDAVSSYGCLLSQVSPNSYQLGEGLIGQSVISQKDICLDNIPHGQVTTSFSFVNISINTIFITPIFLNKKICGVIHFFYINKPSECFFKLLDFVKQKMAFVLQNAILYKNKLLMETEKNEILSKTIHEINEMTEILTMQNNETKKTLHQLAINHKRITESLLYAKRIQTIILPEQQRFSEFFNEYFIIYEPKDIVSGDFYWLIKNQNKVFLAVVDCTGHGVSGAFMSIIGNTLLNKIVVEEHIHSPSEILLKLHQYIQTILQQNTSKNTDGMDLGVCCFELQENTNIKVTFAGAKNDAIFIKYKELYIVKGDRNSIGGAHHTHNKPFHNQTLYMNEGDCLYLFTDGFADACNEKRKKFGEDNLKKLIAEYKGLDMAIQKQFFLDALNKFKGNTDQRDDITFIGIRL